MGKKLKRLAILKRKKAAAKAAAIVTEEGVVVEPVEPVEPAGFLEALLLPLV